MYKTIHGSAHQIDLPDKSVHSIATSPPYLGLRLYHGEQDVDWPAMEYAPMPGLPPIRIEAWRGPMGNEPTLEAYIGHLVLCLREWHRVLRDDGCAFVNLGDSYANDGKWGGSSGGKHVKSLHGDTGIGRGKTHTGLKPKDLCLVPQRFALAAQADGWYVRSEIIWAKGVSFLPDYAGSCMPESVKDRPVRSHEQVWLLTKNARYYWDQEAVKEVSLQPVGKAILTGQIKSAALQDLSSSTLGTNQGDNSRNLRSVWIINPGAYPGAHFATFPEKLVEPMIKASTSAHGCCPNCGAPWRRVVERGKNTGVDGPVDNGTVTLRNDGLRHSGRIGETPTTTTGWEPTCTCPTAEPVPCTVLDPFVGSGTTLRVAMRLGRSAVGVDISEQYLAEHVAERVSNLQFEMSF